MDFAFTPDQELLRETARTLLANECGPTVLRAHRDDPAAADPLWEHLRDFSALGAGPVVDLCVFAEETGAVAAPGPFFATTALFQPVLAAIGSELAEAAAGGERTGTAAIAGTDGVWALNDDPVKTFVPEADLVDVVAIVDGGPEAASVVLVERPPVRRVGTVDSTRRVFEVEVTRGERTAVDPAAIRRVVDRATVVLAAELVGTARRLFDMSLQYAKERHQFGVPIGSFQAIQHKLADMSLDVERGVERGVLRGDGTRRRRPRAAARRPRRQGGGRRGGEARREGRHPDPWRHRLHLGA